MMAPAACNDQPLAHDRHWDCPDHGHKLAFLRAQLQNAISVFRVLKQDALHRPANHLFFLPRHRSIPSLQSRKAAPAYQRANRFCREQRPPPRVFPLRPSGRRQQKPRPAIALPPAATQSSAAAAPMHRAFPPEKSPSAVFRTRAARTTPPAPRQAPESPRTRARKSKRPKSQNHPTHSMRKALEMLIISYYTSTDFSTKT